MSTKHRSDPAGSRRPHSQRVPTGRHAQHAGAAARARPQPGPARLACRLAAAVLVTQAAVSLAPTAAHAAGGYFNVSQIVLGTAEPSIGLPLVPTVCAGACAYASTAGVQMNGSYTLWPGDHEMAQWPPAYIAVAPLYPTVHDTLHLPAPPLGAHNVGLPIGVRERAQVTFSAAPQDPASERQLDVQTWKSGSGASAASFAVRINMPAGPSRPAFLRFEVPQQVRDWRYATQIGGPSGNQPLVTMPARLQARSAVDVYVDGLPVWSSQSLRLLPKRYSPSVPGTVDIKTGPALDGGMVTLFLGTLPANSVRTAVIVLRSDLRVDAPTCHTEPDAAFSDRHRCDAQIEGLSLPSKSSSPWFWHTPDVRLYML
jgi:hypothetical protein